MDAFASERSMTDMNDRSALPLAGLTVLDVASFIAAPVAATIMADYGANVIKIEPPGHGDPNRTLGTIASYPKSPVNYSWEMDSRGKRSIALDLTTAAGQSVLYRLAAACDVFITNYPLAVRDKLKMGQDIIRPLNRRLIYASFTGYGESGPDRHLPGFDSTAFFARSGLLDCNRYEGQPPGVAMPGQGDRVSGMTLFAAIMLALFTRARTGEGDLVTSNLYANGLWSNGVGAQAALLGAFLPPRPPRDRPRNAVTNIYQTKDGRWVQLTIVMEDRHWPLFAEVIGRPDLISDPRFAQTAERRKNGTALAAILDPIFAADTYASWRERLLEKGVPNGLIGQLQDVPNDPQAVAAGAVVETANPKMPRGIAAPFNVGSARVPPHTAAPDLGADTDAVLADADYSADEITALRAAGAFGA
jgi:crotonobetainyl-CoA:carnitine CoA-transferase CaiB-like acyl-CoA transferase